MYKHLTNHPETVEWHKLLKKNKQTIDSQALNDESYHLVIFFITSDVSFSALNNPAFLSIESKFVCFIDLTLCGFALKEAFIGRWHWSVLPPP